MIIKNVISVIEEKVGTAHSPLKIISDDLMFQLSKEEFNSLISQIATSNLKMG